MCKKENICFDLFKHGAAYTLIHRSAKAKGSAATLRNFCLEQTGPDTRDKVRTMMSNEILFVLLSFGLFLLFVLIPIIPAALLYKWFPDTQVSAKGVLSKFKINSSGAFAAYLVTVLLGYFVVADIKQTVLDLAMSSSPYVWIVEGNLQLQDKKGNKVEETALFDQLYFSFKPEFLLQKSGNLKLKIPGPPTGEIPEFFITVIVDGFGQKTISLDKLTDDDAEIDLDRHLITLKKPVIVKTPNVPGRVYRASEYIATE